MNKKPLVTEAFTDNGGHSHWRLINPDTGDLLWSESPEEDKYLYTGSKLSVSQVKDVCGICGESPGFLILTPHGLRCEKHACMQSKH